MRPAALERPGLVTAHRRYLMDSKQDTSWPIVVNSDDGTTIEVAVLDGAIHLAVDRVDPFDRASCTVMLDRRAADDLVHAVMEALSVAAPVQPVARALSARAIQWGDRRLVAATPEAVAEDTGLPVPAVAGVMEKLAALWMTEIAPLPNGTRRYELPCPTV
jgi:hypothetical protein